MQAVSESSQSGWPKLSLMALKVAIDRFQRDKSDPSVIIFWEIKRCQLPHSTKNFSKEKIDGGSVQIKSSTGRFTRSFVFASGVYRINPLKFAKSRSLICDSDHCPLEHFQIFVIFSENTSGVFFFSLQHFSGIRFCLIFKFISFYFV
jgi:hypothetical protein